MKICITFVTPLVEQGSVIDMFRFEICITFLTPLVEQGSVIDMFRFEICITFVMKICDEICDPRDYNL